MYHSFRFRAARVALAALVLFTHTPAFAVTRNWNNAAGGSADAGGNWNPAGAPAAADLLVFNLAGTYTVTFPSPLDSVTSHLFGTGTVSLDCGAPHYGQSLFQVGTSPGFAAVVQLVNGTFRMGRDASIGSSAGATGTLVVSGVSASLTQAPQGSGFEVGRGGSGTLLALGGATVTPATAFVVGSGAGSVGTATITGEVTSPVQQRTSLFTGAPAANVTTTVGKSGGRGTLQVTNSAYWKEVGLLGVGQYASDTGSVTVGGTLGTDSARVEIVGGLAIGDGNFGTLPGGDATFVVDSNGVVTVTGTTRLGSDLGGTATLRVRDKGRFLTGSLTWFDAGSDLDLPGGTVQVNGGTFSTSDQHFKLSSPNRKPVFELMNGATASFHGVGADTPVVIGSKGLGRLRVLSGSTLTTTSGGTLLGQEAGSLGELIVRDGGTIDVDDLHVGRDGAGELHVLSGGIATCKSVMVPRGSGTGTVEVRGTGSSLAAEFLFVPHVSSTGTGDVTVGGGGTVSLASPFDIHSHLRPGGTLHVESGSSVTWSTPFELDGGVLDMQGGTTSGTALLTLAAGGTITGYGVVDAPVASAGDSTGSVTPTGALTLGRTGTTGQGFRFDGTLAVAGDTVTIVDNGRAVLGKVSITGGRLVLPPGGGKIALGRELSGRGTVAGDLLVEGQLRSVGTAGLRFTGPVTGVGHAMLGDKFVFLGGSHFVGAGTIAAAVQFDSLSTLTATGDVVAGLSSATPVLQGRIEPAGFRVEFPAAGDPTLGDEVAFDDGRIVVSGSATRFVLASDGRMTGRGIVEGNLTSSGLLAPGAPYGRLRVTGDFIQAGGTFACDVGGLAGASHDTLVVVGPATLGGTLDVRPQTGFTATTNDSFRVLQCGTRAGTWSTVLYGGLPAAGILEVHYVADGAWVVVKQAALDVGDPAAAPPARALRFAATGSPGPGAALELALPAAADADVRLFDVGGRELATLHHGVLGAGIHRFMLAGRDLPAGVLFARASVAGDGGRVLVTRIVHLR